VNGSVRRISIDRPTERDASVSLALERRCAPADFGVCLEGACGCVSRQVHGPDAVVCECGDGTPA
jgi:hypothetical protein